MIATNLKTDYLTNPIGVSFTSPCLFWNCKDAVKQTAYQILAKDDKGSLLWDSGKVSSSSMHAMWDAKPVKPQTKVLWSVKLWDEQSTEGPWAQASFETGLELSSNAWKAKWITGNYKVNKKKRYPVDCFKKEFNLPSSNADKVSKARLYITACGLYEAKLNGQKVGTFVLAPGITDYKKRVQYQTYDVTSLLASNNTLEVQLADGWYRGSCGAWGLKNQYGTETKLLAQLEITYTNGEKQTIVTDSSWSWSNDGPICFADNKDGEIYAANKTPSYSSKAKETQHPVVPTCSNNVSLEEHETFKGTRIITPTGKLVLDFKQNLAGYVSFSVQAHKGQTIKLRFGELIDETGEFTQKNIQCHNKKITTPLQEVNYICKEGLNNYKTTFAIFGFQYVQVETDVAFKNEDFTAIAVYSSLERTGWFESSNPLLDKLVENTVWSAKNNHADLPTDCPTRERHGWSGDAEIFCPTATYLFNYLPMAEKYLNDMYDWQRKSGNLPQIAPAGGVDFYMYTMNGSVGWSDAGIIMPYVLYKQYKDLRILQDRYQAMKRYAKFMIHRVGRWGGPYARPVKMPHKYKKYLVNRGQSYGEWAEPQDIYTMNFMDFAGPHPEVSTAYTAYVMSLMAEIAQLLGKTEDIGLYEEYANGCRDSYSHLVQTPAFTLDTDRQAQLVRPLAFKLLTPEQTDFAKKRLLQALDNYGWRLGTGFLSTPIILDVLSQIDLKYAYKLLENEEMPGWLFMPKNGATTIWESWEGDKAKGSGVASLNHYSKGAVCRWLFDTMCGIIVKSENTFEIKPQPGGNFTHAKAVYKSIYGEISCSWERTSTGYSYTVNVPANCTAQVFLPNGFTTTQGPGTKTYTEEI